MSALESAAQDSAFGINQKRPTAAQCEAENYKVGRFAWPLGGMTLCIQNPLHSQREGQSKAGVKWSCLMAAHYGYIEGTRGADGDAVDCFIGPDVLSERVFVVNQAFGGKFDEHKVMLCFADPGTAKSAYMRSYMRDWTGFSGMVECSIPQLRWWLRYGDVSQPLDPAKLPYERAQMKTTHWTSDALPLGTTLDAVLTGMRMDDGTDGLLLDSVTMAELLSDPEVTGVLSLDAIVTPFNRLEHKMGLMQKVMDRAAPGVTTTAMQVSDPFKQRGTVNVAVIYELSDGQTITAVFHNPDTTPAKLAPGDDLVSWKWMLNKKDVTIVVAPERGKDLEVREVARRLMRLAEKNSEAFKKANEKRAERMTAIANLKEEIAGLEDALSKAQKELELARLEAEEFEANKAKKHYSDQILDALRELGWLSTPGTENETVTKDFDGLRKPGGAENGRGVIYASFRQDAKRRRYIMVSDGDSDIFDIDCRGRDPVGVAKEINERVNDYVDNRRTVYSYVDANRAKWDAEDAVHAFKTASHDASAQEILDGLIALRDKHGRDAVAQGVKHLYNTNMVAMVQVFGLLNGKQKMVQDLGAVPSDAELIDAIMAYGTAPAAQEPAPTPKDYAFSDADTGFNEWVEGNDARYETAVAIDKAAVAAGMRIQWFKPGNATMDSAFTLDSAQDLEQYEPQEVLALGQAIAQPVQAITMDAAAGVGPCAAFYPAPGSALVGCVVIEDDGGAMVYADAKQEKPMHQTRLYAGDAVQAVELMQQVKGAVFESLPAGLSDLEIAVLLVVNAYKSQYRAEMAQKNTGMSKALYASTLEKLNQQGKYISRNGITKQGRAVVAAFMPQELSSTSKLRVFKGRFDGMQAPITAPATTEPARTGTPEEQDKADEALAMAQSVVQELGGTFEADGFATGATVGAWSYAKATVNAVELQLAASGGGVVQVNGKPHDPSGKVITTREQVREAILAAAPVQVVTGEETARFTRKWPLSVAEALEQGLISQKSGVWRVGIDSKAFSTGLEALDYYYEVVKPRDDARAIRDQSDEAKKRIAAVAAGVALPAYWDGDDAKYATPAGEVVNLTRRELRQRIFQLEEDFGREIVFAKSLEEFDLSAKAIPSDQGGDYMERPADVFNVLRALIDSHGWEKQAAKDIVKKTFDGVARAGAGTFDVYIQDGDAETIYARFGFDDFASVKMEGKTNAQAAQEMEDKAQEHVQQRRKDIAERIEFEQRMTNPAPAANPDRALLEGLIAGTVDAMTVDLNELEAIYTRNADDPDMAALFEKAVDVVAQAELAATENV